MLVNMRTVRAQNAFIEKKLWEDDAECGLINSRKDLVKVFASSISNNEYRNLLLGKSTFGCLASALSSRAGKILTALE